MSSPSASEDAVVAIAVILGVGVIAALIALQCGRRRASPAAAPRPTQRLGSLLSALRDARAESAANALAVAASTAAVTVVTVPLPRWVARSLLLSAGGGDVAVAPPALAAALLERAAAPGARDRLASDAGSERSSDQGSVLGLEIGAPTQPPTASASPARAIAAAADIARASPTSAAAASSVSSAASPSTLHAVETYLLHRHHSPDSMRHLVWLEVVAPASAAAAHWGLSPRARLWCASVGLPPDRLLRLPRAGDAVGAGWAAQHARLLRRMASELNAAISHFGLAVVSPAMVAAAAAGSAPSAAATASSSLSVKPPAPPPSIPAPSGGLPAASHAPTLSSPLAGPAGVASPRVGAAASRPRDPILLDLSRCKFVQYRSGEGGARLLAVLRLWQARHPRLPYKQCQSVIAAVVVHTFAPVPLPPPSPPPGSAGGAASGVGVGANAAGAAPQAAFWGVRMGGGAASSGAAAALLAGAASPRPHAASPSAATSLLPSHVDATHPACAAMLAAYLVFERICDCFLGPLMHPQDAPGPAGASAGVGAGAGPAAVPAASTATTSDEDVELDLPAWTVAPVYAAAEARHVSAFIQLLCYIDPALSTYLNDTKLEPELFVVPFLTTLFADNLPLPAAQAVYDVLLATWPDPRLPLFISVAVLQQVRTNLLGPGPRDPYSLAAAGAAKAGGTAPHATPADAVAITATPAAGSGGSDGLVASGLRGSASASRLRGAEATERGGGMTISASTRSSARTAGSAAAAARGGDDALLATDEVLGHSTRSAAGRRGGGSGDGNGLTTTGSGGLRRQSSSSGSLVRILPPVSSFDNIRAALTSIVGPASAPDATPSAPQPGAEMTPARAVALADEAVRRSQAAAAAAMHGSGVPAAVTFGAEGAFHLRLTLAPLPLQAIAPPHTPPSPVAQPTAVAPIGRRGDAPDAAVTEAAQQPQQQQQWRESIIVVSATPSRFATAWGPGAYLLESSARSRVPLGREPSSGSDGTAPLRLRMRDDGTPILPAQPPASPTLGVGAGAGVAAGSRERAGFSITSRASSQGGKTSLSSPSGTSSAVRSAAPSEQAPAGAGPGSLALTRLTPSAGGAVAPAPAALTSTRSATAGSVSAHSHSLSTGGAAAAARAALMSVRLPFAFPWQQQLSRTTVSAPADMNMGLVVLSKLKEGGVSLDWMAAARAGLAMWAWAPPSIGQIDAWPQQAVLTGGDGDEGSDGTEPEAPLLLAALAALHSPARPSALDLMAPSPDWEALAGWRWRHSGITASDSALVAGASGSAVCPLPLPLRVFLFSKGLSAVRYTEVARIADALLMRHQRDLLRMRVGFVPPTRIASNSAVVAASRSSTLGLQALVRWPMSRSDVLAAEPAGTTTLVAPLLAGRTSTDGDGKPTAVASLGGDSSDGEDGSAAGAAGGSGAVTRAKAISSTSLRLLSMPGDDGADTRSVGSRVTDASRRARPAAPPPPPARVASAPAGLVAGGNHLYDGTLATLSRRLWYSDLLPEASVIGIAGSLLAAATEWVPALHRIATATFAASAVGAPMPSVAEADEEGGGEGDGRPAVATAAPLPLSARVAAAHEAMAASLQADHLASGLGAIIVDCANTSADAHAVWAVAVARAVAAAAQDRVAGLFHAALVTGAAACGLAEVGRGTPMVPAIAARRVARVVRSLLARHLRIVSMPLGCLLPLLAPGGSLAMPTHSATSPPSARAAEAAPAAPSRGASRADGTAPLPASGSFRSPHSGSTAAVAADYVFTVDMLAEVLRSDAAAGGAARPAGAGVGAAAPVAPVHWPQFARAVGEGTGDRRYLIDDDAQGVLQRIREAAQPLLDAHAADRGGSVAPDAGGRAGAMRETPRSAAATPRTSLATRGFSSYGSGSGAAPGSAPVVVSQETWQHPLATLLTATKTAMAADAGADSAFGWTRSPGAGAGAGDRAGERARRRRERRAAAAGGQSPWSPGWLVDEVSDDEGHSGGAASRVGLEGVPVYLHVHGLTTNAVNVLRSLLLRGGTPFVATLHATVGLEV